MKEARERYEKLKVDTAEKIEMAVVSRCNMLSKSLPTYQNGLLAFFDEACKDLQKVLLEIKANHHPQYRRSVEIMEEKDLLQARDGATEATEPQAKDTEDDDVGLLLDIDAFPVADEAQTQPEEDGAQKNTTSTDDVAAPSKEEDDPLLSLLSWGNPVPPADGKQVGTAGDLAPPNGEEQSLEALRGLLKMETLPLQEQAAPGDQPPQDSEDQWDQLSSFLGASAQEQTGEEASSDWQKELECLLGDKPFSAPVEDPLDEFLGGGMPSSNQPAQTQQTGNASSGDLLMAEATLQDSQQPDGSGTLQSLGLWGLSSTPAPHQMTLQPTPMVPSMSTASALPTKQPSAAPMLTSKAAPPTKKQTSSAKTKGAVKDASGSIYEAWSNIFSKLDPLTNDKV